MNGDLGLRLACLEQALQLLENRIAADLIAGTRNLSAVCFPPLAFGELEQDLHLHLAFHLHGHTMQPSCSSADRL